MGLAHIADLEHADVVLRGQQGARLPADRGREDDLDELALEDRASGGRVEFAIEGDDAAECRGRIGAIGETVRVGQVAAQRDAARIGVLDDDAGGLLELPHAFERACRCRRCC